MRPRVVTSRICAFMQPGSEITVAYDDENDVIRMHVGEVTIYLFADSGNTGGKIASDLATALDNLAFDILTQTPGTESHEKANAQTSSDESPLHSE